MASEPIVANIPKLAVELTRIRINTPNSHVMNPTDRETKSLLGHTIHRTTNLII